MLYARWTTIAREHAGELALREVASGRRWTFAELAAEVEDSGPTTAPAVFPSGINASFIFDVLRAWRDRRVLCPLEAGQLPPALPLPPPKCVHLKTTSASTGAARVVAFTTEQLAADADNIVATMGLRAEWPNLGVISLAHSYGFSNLVTPLLLHGIPLILLPSGLPEAMRSVASEGTSFTLAAVPALWRAWHGAKAIPQNIRLAISAGAPLPLPLEEAIFSANGLKIHNFLGASECGGIAYDASETPRTDAACVGLPMGNVHVLVGDDGCLQVHSRAVGQTYWPEPAARLANGCFQTSDLAELRDGLVFLCGRASDQINVAGRKLSPETVERALLAHAAVRDCLVFGMPDGSRGETVAVCLVVGDHVSEEALKQFLLERLPAWQVPRAWRFVDSLAANQRGKLSRAEWRRKYLAGGT